MNSFVHSIISFKYPRVSPETTSTSAVPSGASAEVATGVAADVAAVAIAVMAASTPTSTPTSPIPSLLGLVVGDAAGGFSAVVVTRFVIARYLYYLLFLVDHFNL